MVLSGQHLYFVIAKSQLSSYDQTGARAWFATNPSQFCYKLATPITLTLSPGQVNALLGNNTVWVDDSDNISVTYQSN